MSELKINSKNQLVLPSNSSNPVVIRDGESVEILKNESGDLYCDINVDGRYNYYATTPNEQTTSPDDTVIAICNLRNCLLKMEQDSIREFLGECSKGKCNKSSGQYMKDFLLTSVFVLENLICNKEYDRAEQIIKRLNSCNLCSEDTNKTHKCNCNG